MKRDFQKSLVYAFENSKFKAVSKKQLTLEECTALVEDICRCYGVHSPKVVFKEGYQGKIAAHYHPGKCEILLPVFARHRNFIIHEVSHHIHHLKGDGGASHGPLYFSIYAYLLNQYGCYPLHEIFRKAERIGIQHAYEFPKFISGMVPLPELVVPYS